MKHYHVGGGRFDSHLAFCISFQKIPFTTIHKHGSQQATKAAPKHTHNDRRLSECQNKQVLRRPIFSIGHSSPKWYGISKQYKYLILDHTQALEKKTILIDVTFTYNGRYILFDHDIIFTLIRECISFQCLRIPSIY